MKVYGIYTGDDDCYGLNTPLYESLASAQKTALEMVSVAQCEVNLMKDHLKCDEWEDWKEISTNKWKGGFCNEYLIEIKEVEVLP